jgi:hypothetical protein
MGVAAAKARQRVCCSSWLRPASCYVGCHGCFASAQECYVLRELLQEWVSHNTAQVLHNNLGTASSGEVFG